MNLIHPDDRDALREAEIRAIERAVRKEYEPLLKTASGREERKQVKAAMKAAIQARIAPLLDAAREDSGYCL